MLKLDCDWSDRDFKAIVRKLNAYQPDIVMDGAELEAIDMMLLECRPNLLSLLENPALLEHETFTELLMAVFHLAEGTSPKIRFYDAYRHRQKIISSET